MFRKLFEEGAKRACPLKSLNDDFNFIEYMGTEVRLALPACIRRCCPTGDGLKSVGTHFEQLLQFISS
jgi:hypothetical protein